MGYFVRYFVADERSISLSELRVAIATMGDGYQINRQGELTYGPSVVAEVEVNLPGESLFDCELAEHLAEVESLPDTLGDKQRVLTCLRHAQATVAMLPLGPSQQMAALWYWLGQNRRGILQFDGQGFVDGAGDYVLVTASPE